MTQMGRNDLLTVPLILIVACVLTHWGRVTHICVGKLIIIDSDNGLSPERRQAIIWTNGGILLIGPLGTKFSEILIKIHAFSTKKMQLKMSSGKRRPFCLGLNVLTKIDHVIIYCKLRLTACCCWSVIVGDGNTLAFDDNLINCIH